MRFYQDADAAEKILDDFKSALKQISPTTPEARERLASAATRYERMLAVSRTTLAELEAELTAKPEDAETASRWLQKVSGLIDDSTFRDPDQALKTFEEANAFASKILDVTKSQKVQSRLRALFFLSYTERSIESGRKTLTLLGHDAPPLSLQTWVNTPPLELADHKGKVILIDFVLTMRDRTASVPQVRQWHEKYAGQGLLTIGVTGAVGLQRDGPGLQWDAAQHELSLSPRGTVLSPAQKRESLKNFLDFYDVKYALGAHDGTSHPVYDFGNREGLVVIDRLGKVRMIRVSPNNRDALEVEKLLTELIGTEKK